ncbi:MAG: histone deacetylase [Proteobacteria bacterium]|jgi:acetoin utilization deacetylase AcuC-like enzyme|nr:histone deacetylase [Pseudomonadota bacterium]
MTAGILYSPAFLDHTADGYHPERPERLPAVLRGLEASGALGGALRPQPREALQAEIELVHEHPYVEKTLRALGSGRHGNLDSDTFYSPGSRAAALLAAGGGIDLAHHVHRREVEWGWAIVRPPGHHASAGSAAGFCIFNNVAVAAASLLADGSARRVAIFDWDVHHGNGTQNQFWDSADVLFVSVHQWPHYPGSGLVNEIGGPTAKGRCVNFPFPGGAVDGDYLSVIDSVFAPLARAFAPDHILVSAGFDAHERDPLGGMQLTSACYGAMAARLRALAEELCGGRITLFLEGGYDLQALSESAESVARAMAGGRVPECRSDTTRGCVAVIGAVARAIGPFWPGVQLSLDAR